MYLDYGCDLTYISLTFPFVVLLCPEDHLLVETCWLYYFNDKAYRIKAFQFTPSPNDTYESLGPAILFITLQNTSLNYSLQYMVWLDANISSISPHSSVPVSLEALKN